MVDTFYYSRSRPIAVQWWDEQRDGMAIGPQYAESSKLLAGRCPEGPLALPTVARLAKLAIKANKQFDILVMPGEEHGGGRRGASAPYGDRKVWDFLVTNLLGAKTLEWNEILPATPPGTTSGPPVPKVADLFGPTWRDLATAIGRGH